MTSLERDMSKLLSAAHAVLYPTRRESAERQQLVDDIASVLRRFSEANRQLGGEYGKGTYGPR